MGKNIKYSVSLTLVLLSLVFGYIAYAEESTNNNQQQKVCTQDAKMCSDGSYVGRSGPDCEFVCLEEKNNTNREEFKDENKKIKDDLKSNLLEKKIKIDEIIQSAKEKRGDFKVEVEMIKEQAKLKIAVMKTNLKEDLKIIKNENKKISAEKIVNIIQELNIKLTENLSEKIDKIENVLINIESRVSKAENKGLNVSSVKIEIEKAKVDIVQAKSAISTQIGKIYTVNITNEASLRPEMKNLRDTFSKDIKALHIIVKSVHEAVSSIATVLAKIPKIDDNDDISTNENIDTNSNN